MLELINNLDKKLNELMDDAWKSHGEQHSDGNKMYFYGKHIAYAHALKLIRDLLIDIEANGYIFIGGKSHNHAPTSSVTNNSVFLGNPYNAEIEEIKDRLYKLEKDAEINNPKIQRFKATEEVIVDDIKELKARLDFHKCRIESLSRVAGL